MKKGFEVLAFWRFSVGGDDGVLVPADGAEKNADGQMAILSRKPVGTPVSTGRTAGFIRWKSTAGIPVMPDESGINDRMNSVLHLAIRSIRSHPLNPYKIISGIGVICVNPKVPSSSPSLAL